MIRKYDFQKLKYDVKDCVDEAFKFAKEHEKNENDYILFLARSYYDLKTDTSRFSPWQVDRSIDERNDRHRVEFLLEYLNTQYGFRTENSADSKFTLSLELMIYSHIWESHHNLFNYKKLADLCDSKNYSWNIELGRESRYKFIKKNIKDVFEKHKLKIFKIIDNSYNSQLRNAFAHSLYNFGLSGNNIYLENYDKKDGSIEKLSFDEWTIRFLTSTLLQNSYHNKFNSEIESIEEGKKFQVNMEFNGQKKIGILSYDKKFKRFNASMQ